MRRGGGGAIVNTASVAGLVGAGGLSAYVASKHAVVGLTQCAAIEYAKAGIRVNAVCPGVIETPMLDRLSAELPTLRDALVAMKPMGRLGTPEEVAEAVVWLCSDAAVVRHRPRARRRRRLRRPVRPERRDEMSNSRNESSWTSWPPGRAATSTS